MTDMRPSGGGKTRIVFMAPSRGLIGYRSEFLSDHPRHRRAEPAVLALRPAQG